MMKLPVQRLAECRTKVCEALGLKEEEVEMSMGMSGDFESAVSLPHPLSSALMASPTLWPKGWLSSHCLHAIHWAF